MKGLTVGPLRALKWRYGCVAAPYICHDSWYGLAPMWLLLCPTGQTAWPARALTYHPPLHLIPIPMFVIPL